MEDLEVIGVGERGLDFIMMYWVRGDGIVYGSCVGGLRFINIFFWVYGSLFLSFEGDVEDELLFLLLKNFL